MENTQEREKHYWGYRIDVKNQDFFFKELEQGRLRQGWGYAENQKLPETKDSGARKNLSMHDKVKKGDILLIPRLPDWGSVAIAEAAEDWNEGYKFEIDDEELEELGEDEQEDVHDEVDALVEEEDMEENEDVYDFDNDGIVSKYNITSEDEEF